MAFNLVFPPQKRTFSHILRESFFFLGKCEALDVHFEDLTSGFFVRESASTGNFRGNDESRSTSGIASGSGSTSDAVLPTTSIVLGSNDFSAKTQKDVLHSARFTVLRSAQPVTIRAQYGPFMSRQTVPTQYVVPDISDPDQQRLGLITDFKPQQMDLSAHLVTKQISKDRPVLRVLFHADKQNMAARRMENMNGAFARPATICVQLQALWTTAPDRN